MKLLDEEPRNSSNVAKWRWRANSTADFSNVAVKEQLNQCFLFSFFLKSDW